MHVCIDFEPANREVSSALRGKIALSWSCKDHRAWHYLEYLLKEVPLLVYICGLSKNSMCYVRVLYTCIYVHENTRLICAQKIDGFQC